MGEIDGKALESVCRPTMSNERPNPPKGPPIKRRDTTMFVAPTPAESFVPVALDSYPPPPSTPQGPTETTPRVTVSSVLDHVRHPAAARLERETRIASGGMGSIDVAIDRALDRRVAVKTLHAHLRAEPRAVRMFLREARLTGLLDHPNIVPIYEFGERDGNLFFAMKLVEGKSLADVIRALPRGALDTATLFAVLDMFAKVCDALAFAHSRGVLHCDVKPANVMVGDFGQVFLTDWGIARHIGVTDEPQGIIDLAPRNDELGPPSSAASTSILGTPGYMSPEQARGNRQSLDVRSDVFLLGALLYEVLARRPPYATADRAETLALAAQARYAPPRTVVGEAAVPLELERIVLRAMAPAPKDRYASVAALKDDVVKFMRGGAEFPRRSFAAGEAIVREGEPGEAAYIIVDGHCDIMKSSQVVQRLGPGAVFGEMAILTRGPRTATVIAAEPTTVLVVTSAVLEQEMAALKPWMATLLESLAHRFRDADKAERTSTPRMLSPGRIVHQVLMTIETSGERDAAGALSMPWSVLLADVEAQLGFRSEVLVRALCVYAIEVDLQADRIVICDPVALRTRLRADLTRR